MVLPWLRRCTVFGKLAKLSISLSKILRKNMSPNVWALMAQVRSQFNWPPCTVTGQKAWKLVLMGRCRTMRRTGLRQCHWPWIQSECSCNICDAILGAPKLTYGEGVLAAAQYGDAGESSGSRHCSFSIRWEGQLCQPGPTCWLAFPWLYPRNTCCWEMLRLRRSSKQSYGQRGK